MTTRYPNHPQLVGNYAPLRMECDIDDAIVRGDLPRGLDITYYRNGPDPQFPPRAGYHWLGGDAMVHMFRIRDGRVRYRNRWARTAKWRLERREGRSLYNPFNPKDNDRVTRELPDEGLANTNVVFHGGRLLALYETAAPFELDAATLESVGSWDFDGALPGPMTAHPKIDPATGEMVFFGCVAHPGSRDMYYHVADASGVLTHTDRYEAPFAGMVHDFLVSDEHVAFPHFPLKRDFGRVLRGGSLLAWEPEQGTHVGVMRRDGSTSDMRTFETAPCYGFHPVNAYTDGDRLIAHWLMFEEAPGFPRADGRAKDPEAVRAHLCEWTVDLRGNSNGIAIRYLDDIAGEMPRFDERFAGRPYRHARFMRATLPAPPASWGHATTTQSCITTSRRVHA